MKKNNNSKELGQGLTEYAVVVSLIAVASIAVMTLLGGAVRQQVIALIGAISGDQNIRTQSKDSLKNLSSKAKKQSERSLEGMKIDQQDAGIFGNNNSSSK